MSEQSFDADAYVEAAAAAVGLAIAPAHRPGVVQNLERIAALARRLMDEPLAGTDEPAPVFEP